MSEWYFKKNEQKMGPFTNVEMIALYRKKEINNLTLVQKSPHPEWIAFKQTELYQHIGNHGNSELKISNLFSAVFKKHSKEEGEKVFIAGTKYTTPAISDIPHSWPHPWVFSRVFLVLIVTYFLLLACTYLFDNSNTIPGLMVIGSFAVPFSVLLFFFETNAPRNISVFDVVRMFFIGGVAALVATLVIYSIIPVGKLNYFNALLVGFIEETGKMIIVALFIRSLNSKYVLNGLLIGAAVGAGFAAFESLGTRLTIVWMLPFYSKIFILPVKRCSMLSLAVVGSLSAAMLPGLLLLVPHLLSLKVIKNLECTTFSQELSGNGLLFRLLYISFGIARSIRFQQLHSNKLF